MSAAVSHQFGRNKRNPTILDAGGSGVRRLAVAFAAWDDILYPDGVGSWLAKLDANLDGGGLAADPGFFPNGDDFRGLRVHQTRLQGGDASSDSYCYTR
jgi:hypothetical protein